jgi:hypothetical protein
MTKPVDIFRQIASMRAELDALERAVKDTIGDDLAILIKEKLHLPLKASMLLAALMRHDRLDRAKAIEEIYITRDPPITVNSTINTFMNKVKTALRARDIQIQTVYGLGWYIDTSDKAKLCEVLGI